MRTTCKHALLCGAIGLVVAVCAWLAWSLGSIALGISAWEHLHTLWPALGLGVFAAALAGIMMSLLHRRAASAPHQHIAHADQNAEPARSLASLDDVPALRKRGRAQIRQAQRRTRRRHPLDRQPYLARASPALRWLSISKPLAGLLRGTTANLVGRPVYHLLHPEDVSALDQAFAQARTSRQVQSVLCRFLVADQSGSQQKLTNKKTLRSDTKLLPPLEAASFVYVCMDIWGKRDGAGAVSRYVCRFVDLTPVVLQREQELHLTRKDLASVKKRLRTVGRDLARLKLSYRELYQHAPVMYFSVNIEGTLVTFNDTLLETLGYERHELQDRDYTALLSPATLKSYVTIAESMPAHEGEREAQWLKKNGTVIDVWLHTIPVYDEFGRFVRCRSAALDMTEKNRLANELRARGGELERTNHRLRTINGELEAFTHVVSHDLKEPLRTLQAYSHLLAEEYAGRLGADGFQYVNHLIRASRRLGTLIDELLNLSQAGRITRAPQAFNLNQIVATVRQDLVSLIGRREASILTDGSLPDVSGDPARITQLLANLVANGLKYNQHPAPTIVIGALPCADDPARVTICVRDNGIGIDPAFHQQIFGIFRRLHQAEEYEGTGAGLAICKKIVEAHGGRIWVESQLGQGAAFFFTLPRPASNGKAQAAARPADEAPSSARTRKVLVQSEPSNAALRIVLVEDQPDVAMIIQKLAQRDGLAVTWFPTAEEAWPHLQEHRADLILLDVNLPGISGVELCRRLRGCAPLAHTPVAMFTPDQDADELAKLRAAGADFFMTKDLLCEPLQWQQKIQELLGLIREPAPH
jgi:PAS domain S-box-containing protein